MINSAMEHSFNNNFIEIFLLAASVYRFKIPQGLRSLTFALLKTDYELDHPDHRGFI
jgi:hypothetical protein